MTQATGGWRGRGAAYAASDVHRHGPSLPKIVALLRPRRSDRILDLGTGTGHTAAFLSRWSGDVTGIDPEPDMLAAARAAYGDLHGLAFVPSSAEGLPFADASFDAAVARHTLHHHADVVATLAETHRVLVPGGRFVLVDETPATEGAAAWFDRIERRRDPSHVRARMLSEWHALLDRAGFTWIAGDDRTRYDLDVASWLDRMEAGPEVRREVQDMFRAAPSEIRAAFDVAFAGDDPVRFAMPMNVVLALKEES